MDELKLVLQAIADGYDYAVLKENDNIYISVANPNFEEDNSSNPYLVLCIG